MIKTAALSSCRKYRYILTREWDFLNPVQAVFIGLNPSTADETEDDPTIRRCIGFAKTWNCGGLKMLNLFAFRSTDPKEMTKARDPVGEENNNTILECCKGYSIVIAAWGVHGAYLNRDKKVLNILSDAGISIMCLGKTKDGHPRHPLYVKGDTKPELFK